MEWLTSIRTAVDYMENHLEDNISAQDVADHVYLSPFFLQKGFSLMTEYGILYTHANAQLIEVTIRPWRTWLYALDGVAVLGILACGYGLVKDIKRSKKQKNGN